LTTVEDGLVFKANCEQQERARLTAAVPVLTPAGGSPGSGCLLPARCQPRWCRRAWPPACERRRDRAPTPRTGAQWSGRPGQRDQRDGRSEEHTSELQSRENLVCRLLLEKKNDAAT